MSDFKSALQAKLARNAELSRQRQEAEREMDRLQAAQRDQQVRDRGAREQAQRERHAELVGHLQKVVDGLRSAAPDDFVARMGWSASGEEFMARLSTRGLNPARTLVIQLDRDDDEVLARWTSERGNSIELWRLLQVEPALLDELILQAADQDLWRDADRPPSFPRGGGRAVTGS